MKVGGQANDPLTMFMAVAGSWTSSEKPPDGAQAVSRDFAQNLVASRQIRPSSHFKDLNDRCIAPDDVLSEPLYYFSLYVKLKTLSLSSPSNSIYKRNS
jgi:hypothetical protein